MCRTAAAGAGPRRRRRAQVRTRRITAAGIMLPRGGRQSLAHAETASLRPQAVTHCSRASDRRRPGVTVTLTAAIMMDSEAPGMNRRRLGGSGSVTSQVRA